MPDEPTPDVLDLIEQALEPDDYPIRDTVLYDGDGRVGDYDAQLEKWTIDHERTAAWAVAKLTRIERLRAEAKATSDALRTMADDHERGVFERTERDVRFFTGKLREYHAAETDGQRKRSIELPGGSVLKETKGRVTTIVTDEAAAVAWLEDHHEDVPDGVAYTDAAVAKNPVKAATSSKVGDEPGDYPAMIESTGERVPGIELHRDEPKFEVVLVDPDDTE